MSADIEFQRRLERRLAEERAAVAAPLLRGLAPDHAAYRHACGQIAAFDAALALCGEVAQGLFGLPSPRLKQGAVDLYASPPLRGGEAG